MFTKSSKNNRAHDIQLDSDTSLDKYCNDDDIFSSSTSSSTTSKSSQPKKMFVKQPNARRNSIPRDTDLKSKYDEEDQDFPFRLESRRPSNPLARVDVAQSLVEDALGSTIPEDHKKDESPFPTIKIGSETLEEFQEKELFLRELEEQSHGRDPDYHLLNQQLDSDASPMRLSADQEKFVESFDGNIQQMSTPLHHQPQKNLAQESVTDQLDRELNNEKANSMDNHTMKRVTIVEPSTLSSTTLNNAITKPPARLPSVSTALITSNNRDTSQANKTRKQPQVSGSNVVVPSTKVTKVKIETPRKTSQANSSKSSTQNSARTGTPNSVTQSRPTSGNSTKFTADDKTSSSQIQKLKEEKERLENEIFLLRKNQEESARIRQENFDLRTEIATLRNQIEKSDENKKPLSAEQREVHVLEKLIEDSQNENKKCCEQIKQMEQQQKQLKKAMFDENEKLRHELLQAKSLVEQYEIDHGSFRGKLPTNDDKREIETLKNEIISLRKELNNSAKKIPNEQNFGSLEQRRIKDLERQVKELEVIQRRGQHPSTSQLTTILNPSDDRNDLLMKLTKMEELLKERESRIELLQTQMIQLQEKFSSHQALNLSQHEFSVDPTNQLVNKQLQNPIGRHHDQISKVQMKQENERLKAELEKLKMIKPMKSLKRDLETIKQLRNDLERKNDELEKLRALYDAVTVQHKSLLAERERERTRLAILGNKRYQPDRFIQPDEPIDVIRAENEQLKHLIDKLEQDSREQHGEILRLKDDQQNAIRVALREKEEEISLLRQQHKHELQTMINEICGNTDGVRSNDLLKQVQSQEVIIAQLKKSLENAEEKSRELSILRVREDELQTMVDRLERELNDARIHQTPEMKHFHDLQNQIYQLEQRWQKREQISKDYATNVLKQQELDPNSDVHKLRMIIKEKNREIERFHLELDSMLKLLKTLKFQQLLTRS